MYFDSVHAALWMNGHGIFVWSAYGITFLVLAQLLLWPWSRRRRLLRELRGEQRRSARPAPASGPGASSGPAPPPVPTAATMDTASTMDTVPTITTAPDTEAS